MSDTAGLSSGNPEGTGPYDTNGADRTVSFFQAFGLALKNYFRFTGRSSRGAYWWWVVWMLIYGFATFGIDSALSSRITGGMFELLTSVGVPLDATDSGVTADATQDAPATAATGDGATAPAAAGTDTGSATGAGTAAPAAGATPSPALPESSPAFLAVPIAFLLISLLLIFPNVTVKIRRLHDTGLSGWWFLLVLLPFFGYVILLILCARKPTPGPNRFGPLAEAGRD